MARSSRSSRSLESNVLLDVAGQSRLWSFVGTEPRSPGVRHQSATAMLPSRLVGKGWTQLLKTRLNIAWIGEQPLFLQLVHLPTDDPAEVPSMIELQIEKLSPMPVAQVQWSYEVLPQQPSTGLVALVLLIEKSVLDSLLADLEKRGFQADRIESPLLALIAGTEFTEDGAHLFVFRTGARQTCLIGWVSENALRALNVVNLASDDRWIRQLIDELNRLAWAGELEGWAEGNSGTLHLVADEETLATWKGPLSEAGVQVVPHVRPSDDELATATAVRAAGSQDRANLLPAEFAARSKQQFTDRLWMGGLATLFAVYLAGVLVYLGAVEVQKFRQSRRLEAFGPVNVAYTNTLRLRAQAQVLQETVNLRYAALDCWLATVEAMPEELSLENLTFSGGRSVVISGTAPADQDARITEFWQALRRKVVGNTNLFSEVQLRPTQLRSVRGVPQIQWSFNCTIQRQEI